MSQAILVLVTIALWLALAGAVRYAMYPLLAPDEQYNSPRTPHPRHAGQTQRRTPVPALEAGPPTHSPMGPAGLAAATPQAGKAAASPLPLCVETRPLYMTGEMPRISQETADELWWSL